MEAVDSVESEMVDFYVILVGGRMFWIFLAIRHVCSVIRASIGKH